MIKHFALIRLILCNEDKVQEWIASEFHIVHYSSRRLVHNKVQIIMYIYLRIGTSTKLKIFFYSDTVVKKNSSQVAFSKCWQEECLKFL
jgi:hypothetical protein